MIDQLPNCKWSRESSIVSPMKLGALLKDLNFFWKKKIVMSVGILKANRKQAWGLLVTNFIIISLLKIGKKNW